MAPRIIKSVYNWPQLKKPLSICQSDNSLSPFASQTLLTEVNAGYPTFSRVTRQNS